MSVFNPYRVRVEHSTVHMLFNVKMITKTEVGALGLLTLLESLRVVRFNSGNERSFPLPYWYNTAVS